MELAKFIANVKTGTAVEFAETMQVIAEYYDYRPVRFTNGHGQDQLINEAGQNEGSCKIFAFALLHRLNEAQTLALFGEYYQEVLADKGGTGHQNIRKFCRYGWAGVKFSIAPLTPKENGLQPH